jgi:hypothetical protein
VDEVRVRGRGKWVLVIDGIDSHVTCTMTTAALFANKKNLVAPCLALVQDVKYLVFTSFNVAGDWLGE